MRAGYTGIMFTLSPVITLLLSVLTPITRPRASTSGPPLLPGLIEASVWMKSWYRGVWPPINRSPRPLALTTPTVSELSRLPNGLPTAMAQAPTSSASVLSGIANPAYDQGFTTPWGALTWQLNPQDMLYASAGLGVETYVTPNRTDYGAQAGQPLPAQRSRQVEVGLKHEGQQLGWSLTAFDIHRPYVNDTGTTYAVDGLQRHLGLEAGLDWRDGPWSVHASAMLLRARREGAASAADNGLVPTNVAQRSARAQLGYSPAAMPGLTVQGSVSFEGAREVLPDGSVQIPAWAVLGLSAKQIMRASGHDWTLRAGVDNLLDRRAWKESPYQYGHAYLYPLAPRTFRVSVQVGL